jgi:ankyrin repeat protein
MLINDFNKSLKHYVLIGFLTIASAVFASPNHDVFVAVGRDDPVGLRKALNAGADLNGWSQHQETALTLSLRLGSQRVLKALMAFRELDINRANGAGETPLMLAAIQVEAVWLRRLLLRGAYVNHPGWTALHYACSHNKAGYSTLEVVQHLLEAGADPRLTNEQGLSASDFASKAGKSDVVKLLTQTR